ncbi:MAG: hypothetical protein U9O41_02770 [Candidatus Aerophobetes bacterium]|nr:hypothetical protein [Candidatus Aerophobetes bacterium]
MYLFFIVYEPVLNGEVTSVLNKLKLDRYIKWDKVKGEWKEKHMGTHVWPGEYHTILTMAGEEEVERLKEEIKKLQQKFTADEIWGWKISLKEIV